MAGGRNRSRRGGQNVANAATTAATDYVDYDYYDDYDDYDDDDGDFYAHESDSEEDEHVLGTDQWEVVAHTPAATPQQPSDRQQGGGRRGNNNNTAAKFRQGAAQRQPRITLRNMTYTRDGRPAAQTCAQRQSAMFGEMVAYPRYDNDDTNFEVWVAELFADFMVACEAEVRRISLMKEEVVVWTLRAVLMADAYDISMFHIHFCPLKGCREFRESAPLLCLHIVDRHKSSKQARQIRRDGYYEQPTSNDVDANAEPSPPAATAVTASSAPPPRTAVPLTMSALGMEPVLDAAEVAQQELFTTLHSQLDQQFELLERRARTVEELQCRTVDAALARTLKAQHAELCRMKLYVRDQKSELIYERTVARCCHNSTEAVAQVLLQMQQIVNEQQIIIQSLPYGA